MMFSATDFLPDNIRTLTNLATSTLPNLGSGRISRLGTSRRRGISIPFTLQLSGVFCSLSGDPHSHPLTRPNTGRRHIHPLPGQIRLLLGRFRALGTVLRACLLAVLDALGIERATHH